MKQNLANKRLKFASCLAAAASIVKRYRAEAPEGFDPQNATIAFDDKIFSQQILQQVTKRVAPLSAFARDFSMEAKQIGDSIAVPLVGSATATTYSQTDNSGNPYEQTGGNVSAITVALNENHLVPVDITDLQALNQSPARAEVFAVQAASALVNRVFARITSLVTSVNFGAIVTTLAAASWTLTQIRLLKLTLEQRDATSAKRGLFIPVEIEDTALLGNTSINAAYAYGSSIAIQEGKVPRVLGFDVYALNQIPLNGISLVAWAMDANAIAVAMRMKRPQDLSLLAAYEELTDPASGFSFSYRRHYNPGSGKYHINLECLFGMTQAVTLNLALATKP